MAIAVRKTGLATGGVLLAGLAILATLFAAISVNEPPMASGSVALFFPPWWSSERTIQAALSVGELSGMGGAPFVALVQLDPSAGVRGARGAGAIFILSADPRSLCAST